MLDRFKQDVLNFLNRAHVIQAESAGEHDQFSNDILVMDASVLYHSVTTRGEQDGQIDRQPRREQAKAGDDPFGLLKIRKNLRSGQPE